MIRRLRCRLCRWFMSIMRRHCPEQTFNPDMSLVVDQQLEEIERLKNLLGELSNDSP